MRLYSDQHRDLDGGKRASSYETAAQPDPHLFSSRFIPLARAGREHYDLMQAMSATRPIGVLLARRRRGRRFPGRARTAKAPVVRLPALSGVRTPAHLRTGIRRGRPYPRAGPGPRGRSSSCTRSVLPTTPLNGHRLARAPVHVPTARRRGLWLGPRFMPWGRSHDHGQPRDAARRYPRPATPPGRRGLPAGPGTVDGRASSFPTASGVNSADLVPRRFANMSAAWTLRPPPELIAWQKRPRRAGGAGTCFRRAHVRRIQPGSSARPRPAARRPPPAPAWRRLGGLVPRSWSGCAVALFRRTNGGQRVPEARVSQHTPTSPPSLIRHPIGPKPAATSRGGRASTPTSRAIDRVLRLHALRHPDGHAPPGRRAHGRPTGPEARHARDPSAKLDRLHVPRPAFFPRPFRPIQLNDL